MFGLQAIQPDNCMLLYERLGLLCQTCIPVAMTVADSRCFRALQQLVLAVLPDRLQQAVSCLSVALLHKHQRFVDQRGEDIQHVVCVFWPTCADGLGCFDRKTASKHREPTEDGLFVR